MAGTSTVSQTSFAGRKMMTGTALDDDAKAKAASFFQSNFRQGWFQTSDVSFVPSDTADGQVKGTASAKVPMTIMKMFGSDSTTLNVTCEARKEIGDVDVMFVLDTTGSMACLAGDDLNRCNNYTVTNAQTSGGIWSVTEKTGSRISSLRSAVLTFYDTLAAAADANSRIRYGVVPYSSSVNLGGRVLPTDYIVDSAYYPTRSYSDTNSGSAGAATRNNKTSAECANTDDGQWIHWQRCLGRKNGPGWNSTYGKEGDGKTGTGLAGMGPAGGEVKAPPGEAVMLVEVNYQYRPLFGTWLMGDHMISYTASYIVRDKRDLLGNGGKGLYDPSPAVGTAKMTCDKYSA